MEKQTTFSTTFMKVKSLPLIFGVALTLGFSNDIHAQSTSYNSNSIPVTGSNNCAFGQGALFSNTSGNYNIAIGYSALNANTTGISNVAMGFHALLRNTTGYNNIAVGSNTLTFNTTGYNNTATGYGALYSNTIGRENVAIGTDALSFNTTGTYNTATGYRTLRSNTTGISNVGTGFHALLNNTTGSNNTATGTNTLAANTTGYNNVATGYDALISNTTGYNNVATGFDALYSNTTGSQIVATGMNALRSNTTGNYNVAMGYDALFSNTSGNNNVAVGINTLRANTASNNVGLGANTLVSNTTGDQNIAIGILSLFDNTTGQRNTSLGSQAMRRNVSGRDNCATGIFALFDNTTGIDNTAQGYYALGYNTTGNCNTGMGARTSVSTGNLSNATAIGCSAVVNASNKIRLGNTSVLQVETQTAYTTVSDGRFKTNIRTEDVKGLEFIQKLRPVVYNFDTKKLTEFWTKNMPDSIRKQYMNQDFVASTAVRQSGFIAQEVEAAAKETGYDFNGIHVPENDNDNYSLAYSQFVVPLVKAVQEQQKMIDALQQQIYDLQKGKGETTGINEGLSLTGASMEQNVPNPFSRETIISFNLPQQISNAYLKVYDLSGREIKSLPIHQRGASSITISADQLEAGMYIYSIVADGKMVDSKRMVVAGK